MVGHFSCEMVRFWFVSVCLMDWGWGERAGPSPVFSRKSLVGAENIDLEADLLCVQWHQRDLSDGTGPGSSGATPKDLMYD